MDPDEVAAELVRVRSRLHEQGNHIAAVEGRMGVIEEKLTALAAKVGGLPKSAAAVFLGTLPVLLTVLAANGKL